MRRRRARCAPYGKGRTSGNAVGSCLRANHHMLLCHEACATEAATEAVFFNGAWGEAPNGGAGVPSHPCRRERGARSPRKPSRGTGPRMPRQLSQGQECGAHDARPTGKAVPASTPYDHASEHRMTCRFATRHAPPASQMRRHSLRGLGHRPSGEVQEAGGGLLPQAPKQFRAHGGTGYIAPESLWRGEHEARTMRALRERPCQLQRRTIMPQSTE